MSQNDCHYLQSFWLLVFVPIVGLLFMLVTIFAVHKTRQATRDFQETLRREKVCKCIRIDGDLAFPLVLMRSETFKILGHLTCYEDVFVQGFLKHFDSIESIQKFLARMPLPAFFIFIRHQ